MPKRAICIIESSERFAVTGLEVAVSEESLGSESITAGLEWA